MFTVWSVVFIFFCTTTYSWSKGDNPYTVQDCGVYSFSKNIERIHVPRNQTKGTMKTQNPKDSYMK